jgi:basic amino acid/polyamine antiporter, APA family
MVILPKSRRLRKELSLVDVYVLATGTTLSAGFFLLPGLAAREVGPAMVLSYLIAAVPMVPAMFCAVELATAMPRAGGAYYFLDRSLGPLAGTVGGIGTWLALVLKTSFALVGMGAYLTLLLPNFPILPLTLAFALFFGVVNVFGARKSGQAQLFLVAGLLSILAWFILYGWIWIDLNHFRGLLNPSMDSILSTAGLVSISYVGVTNVASVSEEVKNPEKNLPRGVFLALTTAIVIYALGTFVMVGIVPMDELAGALTPVALVAERLSGRVGVFLVAAAAMLAFSSVANAGILSSSRYPLAMSRDHLLPRFFSVLGKRGTPVNSISVTVAVVVVFLVLFDPAQIAKLASAFQLLVFAGLALAVIVMRESRIESYDPGYRSPAYPWLQIFGIASPLWLIAEMGWMPLLFTATLLALGITWYVYYGRHRVARDGAVYHVFERLGQRRFEGLDRELRSILKEKGAREEDPFDEVVARAFVIDLPHRASFEAVVAEATTRLAARVPCSAELLAQGFLQGTRTGATPVAGGAALPHLRVPDSTRAELALVRCREGVQIDSADVFGDTHGTSCVQALFFLVSPDHDPGQHLRLLAHLAGQIDQDGFLSSWLDASDQSQLVEVLLRDERYLSLVVRNGTPTEAWCGRALSELAFPEGCLVVLIHRQGQTVVPGGSTVLMENDRLTIIGGPAGISRLRTTYSGQAPRRDKDRDHKVETNT